MVATDGRAIAATDVSTRFPCFDGLRAIAAGGVLLVHVTLISGYNGRHPDGLGPYFARLEIGVALFFCISGFLLYRPFVAAAFDGQPGPGLRGYARRRLLRIVPAYWFALTVLAVIFDVSHRNDFDSLREIVIYYGLLQSWFDDTVVGGIQQAWTLSTEMAFYVALPVWALLLRRIGGTATRRRFKVELGALALLYVASLVARWAVVRHHPRGEIVIDASVNQLHTNADLFALGMALAVIREWALRRPEVPRAVEVAGRVGGWWWIGAGVAYWAVCTRVGLPLGIGADDPGEWLWREVLYGATAVLMLLPAVFGPQDRGVVRRGLQLAPLVWLGTVSYGIYLWHEGILEAWRDFRDLAPFTGAVPPQLLVTALGSVVAAAISWYLVERPALARKES